MPNEAKQHWWTTLPGVLTALATFLGAVTALIVALNSAGLLNRVPPGDAGKSTKTSFPETQPHEPKPVEQTPPIVTPKLDEPPKTQEWEYESYFNAKYGFSVIYPKTLLFPEKEESYGRRFKSLDGKVTLSLMAVDNADRQKAPEAYAEMVRTYSQNTPVTILDQRLEPNGYEFRTKNGPRLGHMKMVLNDRYYRVLSMEYDESERTVFDPVWTRISTQFAR